MCLQSKVMPVADWKRVKLLFVNEYIKFYVTAKAYEQKKVSGTRGSNGNA